MSRNRNKFRGRKPAVVIEFTKPLDHMVNGEVVTALETMASTTAMLLRRLTDEVAEMQYALDMHNMFADEARARRRD